MPTYDYRCDACGHAFEKFQSMTAEPVKTCPDCGKNKARRLIGTGAGVIFKGGGFYETDYRSQTYKSDAKKDEPAGGTPETDKAGDQGSEKPAGETKTPAKTETKASGEKKPDARPAKPKAAAKASPEPSKA